MPANTALRALHSTYRKGYRYKRASVLVPELVPENQVQGSRFESIDRERARDLMTAVDQVHKKQGLRLLSFAVQSVQRRWQTRFENRSPHYTTRWDELVQVRAA